jgi:hypothetical protein
MPAKRIMAANITKPRRTSMRPITPAKTAALTPAALTPAALTPAADIREVGAPAVLILAAVIRAAATLKVATTVVAGEEAVVVTEAADITKRHSPARDATSSHRSENVDHAGERRRSAPENLAG